MSAFSEIVRNTFPKKLRFDSANQILYAQLYSASKKYKHKKYIPLSEIENVLALHSRVPYHPWLRLPGVRHVLLIRFVNTIRGLYNKPSWLYNKAVEEEYEKVKKWVEKQSRFAQSKSSSLKRASAAPSSSSRCLVERQKFEDEVLNHFLVASMYQRVARLLIFVCCFLFCLILLSLHVDHLLYLYTRWMGWGKEEVLSWFRNVLIRHVLADVPPAYSHLLPFPCVVRYNARGEKELAISIVELELKEEGITVLAVPTPQIGERLFFSRLGRVFSECDALVVEGVSFEKVDKMIPASLLPLNEDTFPILGVHHRFLDILQSDREPPMLYPGGSKPRWRTLFLQAFTPFEVLCVYQPTMLSASKGEAKVGWGRLREIIDRRRRENASCREEAQIGDESFSARILRRLSLGYYQRPEGFTPSPYVIGIPWTVQHVVNIEASLVKYGFKVNRVFVLPWMTEDYMGERFCEYFGIH